MHPLVSIVVPVYRVPEQYLKKCLESCIDQTLTSIEIIVVHDKSDDNCGEICDLYAERDNRIKVIHKTGKTNAGLSAARNTGFDAATGSWIMFVDGDDWIEPETCKKMLSAAETNENIQLVMCAVNKDYGSRLERVKFPFDDMQYFDVQQCKELQARVLDFNSYIACVYAKLISREYLSNNNIYHDEELKNGVEGLEFNIRMMEKLNGAIFLNHYYYHYMYNDSSLSAVVSDKTNYLIIKGFLKIKDYINTSSNQLLASKFTDRVHYAIITAAISGYFNPANKIHYSMRVQQFEKFLEHDLIVEAIHADHNGKISKSRALALWLIKHRMYLLIYFMAIMRYKQRHL